MKTEKYIPAKWVYRKLTKCKNFKTNIFNDEIFGRLCSRRTKCFNYNPETCIAEYIKIKEKGE